ncbi:MAG: HupE/UreJ family protein [Synechococcales bacterium]|nr:HupE/UreJ family protein [Synechococcales bacterium]
METTRQRLISLKQNHPWKKGIPTRQILLTLGLGLFALLPLALPAYAHHPTGGRLPANAFEGFLSGLGHPVIGFDHLLFVVAAGFAGSLLGRGVVIPMVFVLASLLGTGIHLLAFNLPVPEFMISASVLLFGMILAQGKQTHLLVIAGLGAIAGVFHGYAYGESIVGAEMSPLVAYLLGFTTIQLAISLVAWRVGRFWLKRSITQGLLNLRMVGCVIGGAGAALLSGVVLP